MPLALASSLNVCAPNDATYMVEVGNILGFSDSVTLSTSNLPAGASASFSDNPVTPSDPPATCTLTISNTNAISIGSYDINLVGMAPTSTQTTTVGLNLFDSLPSTVTLGSPANGATDISLSPTFTWTMPSQAANFFELATPLMALLEAAPSIWAPHRAQATSQLSSLTPPPPA